MRFAGLTLTQEVGLNLVPSSDTRVVKLRVRLVVSETVLQEAHEF